MRSLILAAIALAIGAFCGAMFVRVQTAAELGRLSEELRGANSEVGRLSEELKYASVENKRLMRDRERLTRQIEMIETGGEVPAEDAQRAASQLAALSAASEPEPPQYATVDNASAFQAGDETAGTQALPNATHALPESQQPVATVQRPLVEDILYADMETSSDPAEQARLENIHEHLVAVRDSYAVLRDTDDPDQRAQVLNNVLQARQNLKSLVRSQQDEVLRRAVTAAGVTEPEQQEALIESFQEAKDSPYFTEPLLVWGMAAPEF